MTQCSALNCKNKGAHAFPRDQKRRSAWENALGIKNFKAKDTSRLCSMHFRSDDYYGQSKYTIYEPQAKFLKKTAVPSIFSCNISKSVAPSAIARQQQLERRCERKLEVNVIPSTSHSQNHEPLSPSFHEVCFKQEPESCELADVIKEEGSDEAVRETSGGAGVSEAAMLAGLYAGHVVKDELVLGPEVTTRPHVTSLHELQQRDGRS